MSKVVKVYCEGKRGSHDYDLLNKIISRLGSGVILEPIGGKRGVKSAIQVYEALSVKSDYKLFFRDRDFDAQVPDSASLTIVDKYICYSHRITIENYLLSPEVFWQFLQSSDGERERTRFNISSLEEITNIFRDAAFEIRFYQASRHALGKMRVPTDFGTTWTSGSGRLPDNLDRQTCIDRSWAKISDSKSRADSWTRDQLETEIDGFMQKFDDSFFDNMEYLIWFQGKDLASQVGRRLNGFPMRTYYKFAKDRFDYTNFPDLVELRQKLEKALNE